MPREVITTKLLLERDRELDAIARSLLRAREGSGGVVIVEGPAGVGKSGLLAAARASAREARMQVLEARGAALERDFAFGLVRQLFEEAVMDVSGADREALFAGAAGLAARLVGGEDPGSAPQQANVEFGALHGLYWLTANLSDRGATLLSVDDAHLGDLSSLRFLGYLSRRLDGLGVLVVVAGRSLDPEATGLWRELAGDPAAEVLRPGPLSEDAAAALVRDGLGPAADDAFCAACHRATGGNPLFLRELVAALFAAGVSPREEEVGSVTEVGAPAVSRFVLRRLERLGPSATALARAAAVLGADARVGLVARASGLALADAQSLADTLVRAGVLGREEPLEFIHPIVQAAVYESILPGERAAEHAAAARLLDETGAPVDRIATHLLQSTPAGDPWSVEVLRAAAAQAEQRGAPAAALAYLGRALAEPPPAGVRAEVLVPLGRWEAAAQRFEVAERHLLDALEAPADPAVHALAATWLSRSAIAWGEAEPAATALRTIDHLLERTDGDVALELEAEAASLTRMVLPLRRLVKERLARLERHAEGHPRFEAVALIHVAGERAISGGPADEAGAAVEMAMASGVPSDPYAVAGALNTLVTTERYGAATRWLGLAIEAAAAHGLGAQLAALHAQRALLRLATGVVGEAELDAQTALEVAGDRHLAMPRMVGVAIQVGIERGELDAASALADRYGETLARERLFVHEYLISRGRLRVARGDLHEGLADLHRCGAFLEAYSSEELADWRSDAARALAALDRRDEAESLARRAVAAARAAGAPRALSFALRAAGQVIGGDEGLDLLEEAVATAEPSPSRLESAYALAELGSELVARRRRREGRDALRLALEQALGCGATALGERIRGDLGAGGGRPPRLDLTGVNALTPAERRVCDLAACELTNREIAQTLFVTEKTVELHLTNAYRKLGIRSRFQLASVLPGAPS